MSETHEQARCVACGYVGDLEDWYTFDQTKLVGTGRGHTSADEENSCPDCGDEGFPEQIQVCDFCGEIVPSGVCTYCTFNRWGPYMRWGERL